MAPEEPLPASAPSRDEAGCDRKAARPSLRRCRGSAMRTSAASASAYSRSTCGLRRAIANTDACRIRQQQQALARIRRRAHRTFKPCPERPPRDTDERSSRFLVGGALHHDAEIRTAADPKIAAELASAEATLIGRRAIRDPAHHPAGSTINREFACIRLHPCWTIRTTAKYGSQKSIPD